MRQKLAIGFIGLAAVAFVVAVATIVISHGSLLGVSAEGFSRASTNLALLSIALLLWCKALPSEH